MTPEDKIKFIVKAISAQILSRTIVIYSFRYNRYFAHCNGVLFRENDKTYILTAEHVFRKMLHGELKIFLNGFLLYLEGEIIGNPSYDIAIFEIDKKLEPFLLNKYKFLYKNQLLFNHKPEAKQKYFLIGYPSSKVTIRESKIEEKPIIYYTTALVNQLNKNEIEFTYNKRKSKRLDQKGYVIAPDPVGLSGSGVWYITSFAKNPTIKLVGLFKEYDRKRNIGTAIQVDCLKNKII